MNIKLKNKTEKFEMCSAEIMHKISGKQCYQFRINKQYS